MHIDNDNECNSSEMFDPMRWFMGLGIEACRRSCNDVSTQGVRTLPVGELVHTHCILPVVTWQHDAFAKMAGVHMNILMIISTFVLGSYCVKYNYSHFHNDFKM